MFQKSLREVDRIFSNNLHSEFSIKQWREKQEIFIPIFNEDIKPLLSIFLEEPFDKILDSSKEEYLIWPANGVLICEFIMRPPNNYYTSLNKPIPQPDNPKGPSATGIKLSIGVLRGICNDNVIRPPSVEIKFEIWGHEERVRFNQFYKDYRRIIELLLEDLGLDFFTSCCFENVDKYKGSNIIKKIDLYFLNKRDFEALFSMSKYFNKNAKIDRVKKVFINLLILYYCCLGYCQKRQKLDLILDFLRYVN
jgi:hypothetical protein